MNLVLIGYRGTDKSVVGAKLSQQLDLRLFNMDQEIVDQAGMRVPEIVEKHGWTQFRDLETEVARQASLQDGLLVDAGGGVIERDKNVELLKKNGIVFWLTAPVEVIVSRIEAGTERPSLTEGRSFTDEVAEVLERRTPLYRAAAHHMIETGDSTPEEIADRIAEVWAKHPD